MFLFNLPIFRHLMKRSPSTIPSLNRAANVLCTREARHMAVQLLPLCWPSPPCTTTQHKVPTHKTGCINTTLALSPRV